VIDVLRSSFDQAAAVVDPVESTVVLADLALRFRVAGPRLAEAVLRPFGPLVDDTAIPLSTVDLWSADETGVGLPGQIQPGPRRFEPSADGSSALHVDQRSATGLDRRTGDIVGHRQGVDHLAGHELAKPFPEILAVRLFDAGFLKVHAGAVAGPDGAALVIGPSGAGKSTACHAAGLPLLGDDQVAVRDGVAHALYAGTRLAEDQVERLDPEVEVHPVAGEKAIVFLEHLVRSGPVTVLLAPCGAGSVGLRPLSAAAALRVMAPSSVLGVAGGGAAGFDRLAELVAKVPAFTLDHGGSPETAGRLVREALRA
jgi:hypothetical protein